ncbi:hypothetical protein VOLCADRAFT_91947 [Volvox carteri f. nagariensis]|uniref:Cyclic nucleotide-binding domain-containing protein n=1 Tax=Volvox carteri f. nagariensis TaxID=3068 RepID=D8TYD5_VOLCA|nr:uncharacterized protein VOLCADRAFT_91947 [Volvox carteri f. nagariensis]EFJ47535.1 hypothetical protein VOLCADRAFT_91947 [Volvox carteri f. nagariensis]|eukprot:XP_002951359.1 hypothetical protein VOLCADRAFT_91947 [Volvox carteri f. nagariensis]
MDAISDKSMVLRGKSVKFADTTDEPLVKRLGSTSNPSARNSYKSVRNTRTNTSTWLNSSSRNRGKRRWKRFTMRLNPRYWVHVLNKRLPILMPETRKRRYWDFFVLTLVVWTALIVPFEVGFGSIGWRGDYAMERIVDACFWLDIGLNFRTAYIDHSANMVRDGGKIAAHYVRTWFCVDLSASIPFDVIVLWFVKNISNEGLIALGLLRTPRLLRLGRLLRYFDRMKGANIVRMGKLLFFMALVAHWVSCLWFMLYRLTHGSLDWSYDSLSNAKIMTFYLEAYLQSFLLMIGNDISPKNNIERLYCTGILVIGACFYAIVVGHMSLLVNNMNPTASRHKFKKDIINNTVRYLGAPRDIAGRIDQYFDYLTTYSHPGPDGMALISQLPSSMFQDIAIWMYKDLVTKVPLFKECEPAFIAQLVIRLRLAVFLPSEVIFRIGDVGHEMYFITKCVALCHCDLTLLMAHDLVAAMKDFPDSAEKVRAHAVKRLNDMQTAGKVAREAHAYPAPRHLKKLNPAAAEAEEQAAVQIGGGSGGGGSGPGGFGGNPPPGGPPGGGAAAGVGGGGAAAAVGGIGLAAATGPFSPLLAGIPVGFEAGADRTALPPPSFGAQNAGGGAGGASAGGGVAGAGGAATSPGDGGGTAADPTADLSASTLQLVEQVQATITRLTGKIEALQVPLLLREVKVWTGKALRPCSITLFRHCRGKMGKIHTRLGRVETNPNIFNTGAPLGPMAGDPGGAGKNIFDVDFAGGM